MRRLRQHPVVDTAAKRWTALKRVSVKLRPRNHRDLELAGKLDAGSLNPESGWAGARGK